MMTKFVSSRVADEWYTNLSIEDVREAVARGHLIKRGKSARVWWHEKPWRPEEKLSRNP